MQKSGRPSLWLKTPSSPDRATFAIIVRGSDGKATTLRTDALKSISQCYKDGSLSYNEALEAARRELERLRLSHRARTKSTTLRPANLRILERYWKEMYEHRNIEAPDKAWDRLRRAVEDLEDVPLTADRNTLQAQINRKLRGNNSRHRTTASALNQILQWLGRGDVKLHRDPKEHPTPLHLTIKEFEQVLPFLEDPFRSLFAATFATGCRIGETYALTTFQDPVWIPSQMKPDLRIRPTKNRRRRHAPVIPELSKYLEKWIAIPLSEREEIRNSRHADILGTACTKAFPGRADKILTTRDLRHSYAIHLLSRGASISMIAQSLGDSIQVCQEYYTGFTLGDEAITAVKALLR